MPSSAMQWSTFAHQNYNTISHSENQFDNTPLTVHHICILQTQPLPVAK